MRSDAARNPREFSASPAAAIRKMKSQPCRCALKERSSRNDRARCFTLRRRIARKSVAAKRWPKEIRHGAVDRARAVVNLAGRAGDAIVSLLGKIESKIDRDSRGT